MVCRRYSARVFPLCVEGNESQFDLFGVALSVRSISTIQRVGGAMLVTVNIMLMSEYPNHPMEDSDLEHQPPNLIPDSN